MGKYFEYKTVLIEGRLFLTRSIDFSKINREMDKHGKEGWELVNVHQADQTWGSSKGLLCHFKRCVYTRTAAKRGHINAPMMDMGTQGHAQHHNPNVRAHLQAAPIQAPTPVAPPPKKRGFWS